MGLESKHKINSYLIYLEHNLKDYFYLFLSLCVCVHDAYMWVLVPQQESGSQRPSPQFSPICLRVLRFEHWLPSLFHKSFTHCVISLAPA